MIAWGWYGPCLGLSEELFIRLLSEVLHAPVALMVVCSAMSRQQQGMRLPPGLESLIALREHED